MEKHLIEIDSTTGVVKREWFSAVPDAEAAVYPELTPGAEWVDVTGDGRDYGRLTGYKYDKGEWIALPVVEPASNTAQDQLSALSDQLTSLTADIQFVKAALSILVGKV